MSSDPRSTSQPEEHGIFYPGKVGQRTQMTRSHESPITPPVLPPPSQLMGLGRTLPPLPALTIASRAGNPAGQAPLGRTFELPQASPRSQHALPGPALSFPHPALYPQRASYQSRNPGTVYEALSPVEYGTGHGLFNQATYPPNPHSSGPVSTFANSSSSAGASAGARPQSRPSSTASSSGAGSMEGSARSSLYQPSPQAALHMSGGPRPKSQDQTASMNQRCTLTIRQQPMAARACGFGERDRRVIDPPPIVQLSLTDFNPACKEDIAELQYPFHIMHCALLSASPASTATQSRPTSTPQSSTGSPSSSDVTAVTDPDQTDRVSRRLMGTLVASPFAGTDPEIPEANPKQSRLGTFFIFPDLSCRQNGLYRLRFTLMKVDMSQDAAEGGQGHVCGSIDSDIFTVFSAKDFPGMTASSRLIRELKKQGAPVSVRKGKDRGRSKKEAAEKRASSVSGSADDEDEVDKGPRTRKKRA